MELFRPKHTLSSVVQDLIEGLDNHTIAPPTAHAQLFPNLGRVLTIAVRGYSDAGAVVSMVLENIPRIQRPFAQAIDDLMSLNQLVREIRQSPQLAAIHELEGALKLVGKRLDLLLEETPTHEIVTLGRMIAIAVEEDTTSIIEEISIHLQVRLAETRMMLLDRAGVYVFQAVTEIMAAAGRHYVGLEISAALAEANRPLVEEVETFITTLRLALGQAHDHAISLEVARAAESYGRSSTTAAPSFRRTSSE